MVTAHNSPFVRKGNAAANQALSVTAQLNDGIRMLQGQTHSVNGTLYYCHTSCDILNVGTVESQLKTIADWVAVHPYDVVTVLIGNGDLVDIEPYVEPIQNSGLGKYAYTPPKIPMGLGDWPTLEELILTQKRVIIFMDYNANQTIVPYVIDEFTNMWESTYSPTDPAFPCNVQRPPGLSLPDAQNRLYMANHNLNEEISLFGSSLLVPNTVEINQTNAISGNGSLGTMAQTCKDDYNRAPNFLLVDYYNYGNFPGSVFEVAAEYNNVTYTGKCCGLATSGASDQLLRASHFAATVFFVFMAFAL